MTDWKYLLDFNEGCPNVAYLLEFLRRVREATPTGFDRILYIEQPTARDLQKDRANVMHEAARLRPVVIDESLTDLETLLLAREMGYTGVALKACKGQSAGDADGGGRAEVRDVPVRAGSDLPGRVADPLGRHRRARAGQRRHRSQRAPVRARAPTRRGKRASRACSRFATA